MDNRFDTKIQFLKYSVLKEVARKAWNDKLEEVIDIPQIIVPGKIPTMRCCVYKERAILGERVKLAMGGDKSNPNIIEVIDIACDDCPSGGYEVTDACRGCLAHRCMEVCPRNAIYLDEKQHAHIDKTKCVECGLCSKSCPYSSIINYKRPCQSACKVGAISMNEDKSAKVNNDKCISCGACVYMCPFGAISDKSYILEAINLIKGSNNGKNYKVYAIVAPSIASQFDYAKLGQVVTGIEKIGFSSVVEVALGADMTAKEESTEFTHKEFMTTSCCPAFVKYIKTQFPELAQDISTTLSPMAILGKYLKQQDPTCKVVFIGPCTAKKLECNDERVKDFVDTVLTFEELQALIDSLDIDLVTLEETKLEGASYFGRIFAGSGGVTKAVIQAIQEFGINAEFNPVVADGIQNCKTALLKAKNKCLGGNFIEGMVCEGGCINGAGCLKHGVKNKMSVEKYGNEAEIKEIKQSLDNLSEN